MAETCIIWDRPQMVGEFYEPVRIPGVMELIEKTNLPREATSLAYPKSARRVVYDPEWESILWAE